MYLFNERITNEQDWETVYQSIPAFALLIEHIMIKERLPVAKIENLTPGTNAVFKVGGYVIKIFAPEESGFDQVCDLETELFATRWANQLNISAPRVIANGFVEDKYHFSYMIMEYIEGVEFIEAVKTMTDAEKTDFGRKLRNITDRMNIPCEPFNDIDVINDRGRYRRWDIYPEQFKKERLEYIKSHMYDEKVFVHGDLCGDNILLTPQGELYILDFADAVLAPLIYEHTLLVFVFEFDPALLKGYFGDLSTDAYMDMLFNGLLIHDFGGDIVKDCFGKPDQFHTLDDLRKSLKEKVKIE